METTSPHHPSVEDVLAVKDFLFNKFDLPIEIIDVVIDFAEYWPCTSTTRTGGKVITVEAGRPMNENKFIIRSYPLGYVTTKDDPTTCSMLDTDLYPTLEPRPWVVPQNIPGDVTAEVAAQMLKNAQIRGEHPCRKVVFTIKSHDQGWGGTRDQRGTYKGSYTWFEAGKEGLTAFKDTFKVPPSKNMPPAGSSASQAVFERPGQPQVPSQEDDMESLPKFNFPFDKHSDDSPNSEPSASNRPDTVCTVRTLWPKIESRTTAHEPPQTESWFSHALMPSDDCIQKNRTATREWQTNIIEWRYDDDVLNPECLEASHLIEQGRGPLSKSGEYVRNLKVGDAVTVWAKARFPLWVNSIEEVKIDIYWAV